MGHERIGYLPKTKKWLAVVGDITSYTSNNRESVSTISSQTLKNVHYKFSDIIDDTGVRSAIEYLILLTLIPKKDNWKEFLNSKGIALEEKFSLLQTISNAKKFILSNESSKEYSAIAIQSVADSITQWTSGVKQGNLFNSSDLQSEIWRKSSYGSGFCELSRLFFSSFTEHYLRYFLEREAFGRINSLTDLNDFTENLKRHVSDISKHAFEISEITQSYSAGWYNKHVKDKLPNKETVGLFVDYSFKKLSSEIMSEQARG
jgi:hypothetical protein